MSYNNVIKTFFQRNFEKPLTEEQLLLIEQSFKKEVFKRKETVFRNGDVNTRHYFIEQGLMRLYLIDSEGKEFNILFAKENQIIGDLITPHPTDFNLETFEKTTAYSISENELKDLMNSFELQRRSNNDSTLRRSYIAIQKRLVSILANTAEENYLTFKKRNPDLIQRLPQYHIASYLGISAEFLSKIIARTTKKI